MCEDSHGELRAALRSLFAPAILWYMTTELRSCTQLPLSGKVTLWALESCVLKSNSINYYAAGFPGIIVKATFSPQALPSLFKPILSFMLCLPWAFLWQLLKAEIRIPLPSRLSSQLGAVDKCRRKRPVKILLVIRTVPLKGTVRCQLLLFPYARISTRSSPRCHSAYQPWTAIYKFAVQNVYFILMNWLAQIFCYSNKRLTDTTGFYFLFLAADIEFLRVV